MSARTILPLTYLGNVQWFAHLLADDCVIDIDEYYLKQSYRNRTVIAAAFEEMMRSDVYADGFLIYDKDELAGYAMTAKTYSHEAGGLCVWIEELYLTPAHRGKGLGHEFFAFAEDFYGKDLRRMRLETEPENEKAEKLYRNLGFDELGYRPFVKEFAKK